MKQKKPETNVSGFFCRIFLGLLPFTVGGVALKCFGTKWRIYFMA